MTKAVIVESPDGIHWEMEPEAFEELEDNLVVVKPLDSDYWVKGRLSDILRVVRPPGTALIDIGQIFGVEKFEDIVPDEVFDLPSGIEDDA